MNLAKLGWLGALGLVASCGAEDPPPVCPTGDCTLPARAVVKWKLNHYPELLFEGDTCQDVGARTARVELAGVDDPTFYEVEEVDCSQNQASFLGMPAGNYTALLTPLDAVGNPLVAVASSMPVTVGVPGSESSVTILVPYESWTSTYTGTLLFRLAWGGASCEAAVPNVATQTLTLMVDGGTIVTTVVTDSGQRLDGTDPQPCRPNTEPFAQFAEGLPFGPATLTVTGSDAGGTLAFEHTFDTFIGAGKNNPTIMFDVAALPPSMP